MSMLRIAPLVACLVAVAPSPAVAAWSRPADLSPPAARSGAVAAVGAGAFVVAWTHGRGVVQARRVTRDRVGPVRTLATGSDARVWPAPRGSAVVSWRSGRGAIGLRTIGPGDRLGPRVRVAAQGSDVVVVPRADGSTTTAWIGAGGAVQARRISPRGVAGPVTTLTADTRATELVGAADMDGGALLVYATGGMLVGQRILGDGTATRPSFPISPLGQTARSPQLATDGTGGATVLWEQDRTIQEVAVIADDKLSGLEPLSAPGVVALSPDLAFRGGSGVTVWETRTSHGATVVGLDSDGRETTLARAPGAARLRPQAAIDAAGHGFAVWRAAGLVRATRFGGGRHEPAITLGRGTRPQIAATGSGRALAIWVHAGRVRSALYDPPRSRLANLPNRR